ncbi:MAG: nucleoside-diphosphate kinase [Verrucomicrobia bacterium Tous-C9LFEB]|nr:MAG: nucleoside-diphosphate kinase [Verrucomicrobia bacterium Tous-C9LFEB]
MAEELSYVIINPYTVSKSRTGGIIARLLTRTALDLVSAQMFAPSAQLVEEYNKHVVTDKDPQDRFIQELIRDYIKENFSPDPVTGQRKRLMMLLFRGDDAVRKVRESVGNIKKNSPRGETIRETYGDFILNRDGTVRYFEPAVLASPNVDEARTKLKIWAKYSEGDGGLLDSKLITLPTGTDPQHERTLVIIKPDNFRYPSGRPGNIIDIFSRTGLAITSIKLHRMSVAEAEEFYGPVRQVLRDKLGGSIADRASELLETAMDLKIDKDTRANLAKLLGPLAGDQQFNNIVKFMTGRCPSECPPEERTMLGLEKCIVLTYEGVDAVRKIREVLGPTDPSKAPPGSIRREFGQTIMVNAAHASDSAENAQREQGIVKVRQNNFKSVVESFYGD